MANTNIPLPGYPQPVGEKYQEIFDHAGPASYTQFSPGASPTGGDIINALDLGFGGFDKVDGGYDSTGQFSIAVIPVGGGNGNAIKSYTLKWTAQVTATLGGQAQTAGSEAVAATNLSTFYTRLTAWLV